MTMWVACRASKDTVAILSALQRAYPEPQSPSEEVLHLLLGPVNRRITSAAVGLLEKGDGQGIGVFSEQSSGCTTADVPRRMYHGSSANMHQICFTNRA